MLSPQQKTLSILIAFVLFFGFYIVFSVKRISIDVNTENLRIGGGVAQENAALVKINRQELEKKYKEQIKSVLEDCEKIVAEQEGEEDREELLSSIAQTKQKISQIVAPSRDLKDVHVNLTFSLINYEEYLLKKEASFQEKSRHLFEQAKQDIILNNYESS